jgi:hypothetical protein
LQVLEQLDVVSSGSVDLHNFPEEQNWSLVIAQVLLNIA